MKVKKFLIMFLISLFVFGKVSEAKQIPISTTVKKGVYKISSDHVGYYRNIKLTTPDKPVTIILLNSNGDQILFAKLKSEQEFIKFGPIEKDETLIVNGDGEISINH